MDKQKELLKYMAEHSGISMRQAMVDVGYSQAYADGGHIKETKGWKELMKEYLPDDKLFIVIKEGLDANRVISAMSGKQASGATSDFIEVPDHAVRHKFVETALKMKGRLVDKADITSGGQPILGGLTNVQTHHSDQKADETSQEN